MTPQEIDRIENAIRHIESSLDVDPWAVEIAVEAMKTQLSAEGTTSDLISRQDAIDVLGVFTQADALGHTPKQIVEALPSAHPEIEERKAESAQNVPIEDLISRKAAIEAMSESLKRVFPEHRQIAEKCLKALPSAQSEVIKCENCKYRGEKPIADGRYWCDIHDTYMYYCSDAERRTDDANADA